MVEIVKGMKASVDNPSNPGYAATGAKGVASTAKTLHRH